MERTGINHMDAIIAKAVGLVKSDERAIAAGFVGSLATGGFSEFSDIDMCVFTEDKDSDDMCVAIEEFAKKLPDHIIGGYYEFREDHRVGDSYWCYLTDKLTNFDIEVVSRSKARPDCRFKGIVVVKDKDGFLEDIGRRSSTLEPVLRVTKEEFRFFLLMRRTDFEYAAREFRKGEKLEAIENVKWVHKELLDFGRRLEGVKIRDFRKLEQILTDDERVAFDEVYSLRINTKDVKRGLKINWGLMERLDGIFEERYGDLGYSEFDKRLWKRIGQLLD